jgi:hypothetical protein
VVVAELMEEVDLVLMDDSIGSGRSVRFTSQTVGGTNVQ